MCLNIKGGIRAGTGLWSVGPSHGQQEQAGTDAQEAPPEHEEESPCAGTKHWDRMSIKHVESAYWRYSRTIWRRSCAPE